MRCPPPCWLAWLLAALCISAAATASSRSSIPTADRATTPSRIADRAWEEEIVYTMYLGNFVDGNTSNNVMLNAYGPLLGVDSNGVDHGGYLGGDLDGVIQKLDYFADLGITTLFLSPVVQNDKAGFFGYYAGGYRARDYHAVDENLGTTDTLVQLIDQAHARGMRVMIDMPLSLCGIENPMNTAANAANGYFNGTAWGMRVWNADNPTVAAHLTEVAAFWRDLTGCDGLRLDSCQLLSNAFWTSFAAQVDGQAAPDNLFLMAELTSGPAVIGSFLSQTKFDSAYDFSFLACQGVFGANQNVSEIDFVTQQAQQNYPNPNRMCSEIDNYGDTFAGKSLGARVRPHQACAGVHADHEPHTDPLRRRRDRLLEQGSGRCVRPGKGGSVNPAVPQAVDRPAQEPRGFEPRHLHQGAKLKSDLCLQEGFRRLDHPCGHQQLRCAEAGQLLDPGRSLEFAGAIRSDAGPGGKAGQFGRLGLRAPIQRRHS